MADLLECVIQIKALSETLDMATLAITGGRSTEMGPVPVSGVWQRMADAERRYAEALGTVVAERAGASRVPQGEPDARTVFAALRRANLAMLEGCTAAQLSGVIAWPHRPSTAVADLVAIMLSHDTEVLGDLRRTRPRPTAPGTS